MITGHQIEKTILSLRKRPKKISSNAAITRKPFRD